MLRGLFARPAARGSLLGALDDQFGFKTGAGYAKPRLKQRNLAEAINAVLAGKKVSRPVVEADGCFIGRVAKTAPHGDITYSKQIRTSCKTAAWNAIARAKRPPSQ